MKPLLIGEAPGPNGDAERPLDGKPSGRLLECMGWNRTELEGIDTGETLREMFEIRNLIDQPMPRPEGAKGCEWPRDEARESASRLERLVEREQPVVLLGKRVAGAFNASDEYWTWGNRRARSFLYATIPHPSGIVRLWNDPVNRVKAGYVLWLALGKMGPLP